MKATCSSSVLSAEISPVPLSSLYCFSSHFLKSAWAPFGTSDDLVYTCFLSP